MLHSHIRGDDAFARPFYAIHSSESALENMLTSARFTSSPPPALPPQPPLPLQQKGVNWVTEILLQGDKS
jgi:hypothetical protein